MGYAFWLLVLAQGLATVNGVILIGISALAGLSLAPEPRWATLPATATVLGSALATVLVAGLHRRFGRRTGFQLGLGLGALGFGVCAWALARGSFGLLLLGSLLAGVSGASVSLYRFAATEVVPTALRERALALILVGGLLGALGGPWLIERSRAWAADPYSGPYAALGLCSAVSLLLVSLIRFPRMEGGATGGGGSLGRLVRRPGFLLAVAGGALGFGVMNLLMTATPIAMQQHHHGLEHSSRVLQAHVIAMFAPSLFSGRLIQRFGARAVMGAGLLLNALCAGIALGGADLHHFWWALVVLGLGWNLLFTGASALLLTTYAPEERTTAQGAMDFGTFGVLTVSSMGAGLLVTGPGWNALLWTALLPLLGLALALALAPRRG